MTHRGPNSTSLQNTPFHRTFAVVRNGFATGSALGNGTISGCLYSHDGKKVRGSERFGGFRGDRVRSANPEHVPTPENPRHLGGRGVYLGHFMSGHYGHFMVETVSTFWIFEEFNATQFDYVLFHPFIFGTALPEYAETTLKRFQVSPDQVVIVGQEPISLQEILVPNRLVRLNHSADKSLRSVYHTIADINGHTEPPSGRLYISRRRINRKHFGRVIANEVKIEALFYKLGFEIFYPEETPFNKQLGAYRDAAILAGPSGSGLHNSLFMQEGALVIELGDPRYNGTSAPTQQICNHIAGTDSHFIEFRGWQIGPRMTMLFNVSYLQDRLHAVLGGEPRVPLPPRPYVRQSPYRQSRALFEIAFRTVRPTLGHLARKLSMIVRQLFECRGQGLRRLNHSMLAKISSAVRDQTKRYRNR